MKKDPYVFIDHIRESIEMIESEKLRHSLNTMPFVYNAMLTPWNPFGLFHRGEAYFTGDI